MYTKKTSLPIIRFGCLFNKVYEAALYCCYKQNVWKVELTPYDWFSLLYAAFKCHFSLRRLLSLLCQPRFLVHWNKLLWALSPLFVFEREGSFTMYECSNAIGSLTTTNKLLFSIQIFSFSFLSKMADPYN